MKCITFDKEAQGALPNHIKDKMKADREKARAEQHSRYAAAFMHACPSARNAGDGTIECMVSARRILKCTADCGAIKDFLNYLETHK